ncbi:MAG: M20/M25/M40 family metallo-hydrolase [Clostridia bacterium]|nr:M20/M25/M40 family metallo-hydrolase [Clostridia bacterium]
MLNEKMENYAAASIEDLKKLIRELAVIPSPSHFEDFRVEYLTKYLKGQGVQKVHTDDAKNVIWSFGDTGTNDLAVLMSHTDVVFPDTKPLPLVIKDDRYCCPGIIDDVAPLCVLLTSALYFYKNGLSPKTGLLIVANSCEEGLGNLKGSRSIVDTYGDRIKELITVESDRNRLTTRAVGSHRYEVTVRTEGGHSFGNFGNRNAIQYLAAMIGSLYEIKVPVKPDTKTTYNVGIISGGTSVNTIAQEAKMLYEYRSDDYECLDIMKNAFLGVINDYRAQNLDVEIKLIGERPCGNISKEALRPLEEKIENCIKETVGGEIDYHSSSTDANYPLSKGIPAICMGSVEDHGAHTREEYLMLEDLLPAMRLILDVLNTYF